MKKANKKFKQAEYFDARLMYQKLLDKGYNVAEANFKIAESYRLANNIKDAQPFYEAAIQNNYPNEEVYFYYALAQKNNEEYDKARQTLNQYLDRGKDEELVLLANKEIENLDLIDELKKKESFFRVKNLEEINTPNAEY